MESVVVDNFCVLGSAGGPAKAKPPLVVDPDAVLALAVFLRCLQLVLRGNFQVGQRSGPIEHCQLSHGHRFNVDPPFYPPTFKQFLCVFASEAENHDTIVTPGISNVKRNHCELTLNAGRHISNNAFMTESLFSIQGLTKRYGNTTVVNDLSFDIAPGECLGVIGPNGAGKTTTIRMCLGLTVPDAGRITAFGLQMPQDALAIKEQLGIVSQFDSLDPDFSCAENLLVFGRYFGMKDAVIKARIPKLLEFAALTSKADAKLSELSGGMKRRLSLARALVNDPQLLLLDEPTTGLDPQARHLMWERLQRLVQQGKSILLTTHFMDEAERLCNRLLVLDHGKKMTEGAPRQLIADNLEPDVVEVYGAGALALADSPLKLLAARTEVSGETVFFYTQDAKRLLDALTAYPQLRTLHRPANLEDLFLKLTGRQIREDA
jgi:lipooligosaccharide transport system ATP-binding protein